MILGGGGNFQSQTNPRVVVQAGTAGSQGVLEISDLILSTAGPGQFNVIWLHFISTWILSSSWSDLT